MRTRKSKFAGLLLLVVIVYLVLKVGAIAPNHADRTGTEALPEGLSEPYEVVRIVDGDTIIVDIDGKRERVRLIDVDTPESVAEEEERNVPYGKVAAKFTEEALAGKRVELEYDVEPRDRYGRLLAYVYVDGLMLNEMLLREGHARVITCPPNLRYIERFRDIQKEARDAGRGIWTPGEEVWPSDHR